jgi:stage II sporulation protein D
MSRTRRLLTMTVAAVVLVPLPAYAARPDAAPGAGRAHDHRVERAAKVTIEGRGYGHGRGMSQWGAHDAAERGLSYRRILKFYYPHTKLGRTGGGIHVEITGDTSADVVVVDRPGLKVKALASGRSWKPRVDATRWRIQPRSGDSVVSYLKGSWHTWRTIAGDAEFSAGNDPLTLVTPSGRVAYRGTLRTASLTDDGGNPYRATVNVVSLENYVKGVVPQEVPASWPAAAVRAQAVAARTYAAFLRRDSSDPICDTTSCQVYGGFSAEHPDSNDAVRTTARRAILFHGKPAFTEFSASNGGWTARGQVHGKNVAYLPAKRDPYDHAYRSWTRTVSARAVERLRPAIGDLRKIVVPKRDGHGAWNGRAVTVTLVGTDQRVSMTGEEFRSGLALMSTWFKRPVVR